MNQKQNRILLVTTQRSSHASKLEEELNSLEMHYLRLNTDNSELEALPQFKLDNNSTNVWINNQEEVDLSQFKTI